MPSYNRHGGGRNFALLCFLALFVPALSAGEDLARNIAQAAMVLAAAPLMLAVPALILGLQARALKTAFALALIALPVSVVLFLLA